MIENLARDRARKAFGVTHANVQPYSGSPANFAVYVATCKLGDVIMGQSLPDGGHLTHGWKVSVTGQFFKSVPYHVKPDGYLDLEEVERLAKEHKPTLIWVGSTAYAREFPFEEFAKIADALRQRGHDAHDAAHFLMKCMFCLFAEDVSLLPEGLFSKLLQAARSKPKTLTERLSGLFEAMRTGGFFGTETIAHFDGGLFDEAPALALKAYDMHNMLLAGEFDWAAVEPTIFGTLFERSLDPSKRSQIGAHYTSREDIMLIVEPVVMQPLRREWGELRE